MFDSEIGKFAYWCVTCCHECASVFEEKYYKHKSVISSKEAEFAGGFLMKLVHILRNIHLANKFGSKTLDSLMKTCESVHLKLLYQNLILTTPQMDPGNELEAKTILAIAANWLAMRHTLIYSSTVYFAKKHVAVVERLVDTMAL